MKNASLAINIVLAIAVAVLYYLHFKEHKSDADVKETPKLVEGRKLVYVNIDSLASNYDYFKDTRKVLESKQYQLENDIQTRGRSLQNEVAFFQQRAQTMTQEQGRAAQASLEKKNQDLMAYREQAAQGLAMEKAKKDEELYNQIFDYLKKVNGQNKYEMVLGYQKGGNILFADGGSDATKRIIDGLNKEYKEKQAAAKK
ncbi:OmpH family outer membrane protein [Fibrella forsythiae]|uniref:OmpH family outer membrane protein n=1 Tax=Fibrella forsythiae TaxID=2817061 RepID=A0ABS3JE50_9BACT|nr:OmpH family outer membrane protein [Fibrella forsythiae]MBO0948279.1 OmpH family outer membrane protein [Fibrella forsythiae]